MTLSLIKKQRHQENRKRNMAKLQASGIKFVEFNGTGQVRIEDWSTWEFLATTGRWRNNKTGAYGRGWNSLQHDIKRDRVLVVCFGSSDALELSQNAKYRKKYRFVNINSVGIDENQPLKWRLSYELAKAVADGVWVSEYVDSLRESWQQLGAQELPPMQADE